MDSKIVVVLSVLLAFGGAEDDSGVLYPTECEVCKLLSLELESELAVSGKSSDVLDLGYQFDAPNKKKKVQYKKSELRLEEAMESVCDNMMQYNIHKERTDSTRFSKGMSQTFKALHGLVDKGVKVDLGIPYDLWDKPSAEITDLKSKCEAMKEKYEEEISSWYFKHQEEENLRSFLCSKTVLKEGADQCLFEEPKLKGDPGTHAEL